MRPQRMSDFASTWSRWRRLGVPFAAGLTLLGFTLVNFLNYNSYPLLRPEVGYFYAGLILLCALMTALYSGQRAWGRALLEALLVAAIIDLNLDSLWLTGAAFVASFAFVMWTRKSLLPFAALMGTVMLVIAVIGFSRGDELIETKAAMAPHAVVSTRPRPAILHIILDEHTGFEGFPVKDRTGAKMKAELRDFYGSRGFAMFGRAYSEHYITANSIPQILNLGGLPPRQKDPKHSVSVWPNRYFEALLRQGYAVRIYQNKGYLNFCDEAAQVTCTQYSSLLPMLGDSLTIKDRAQLLLFKFLSLSPALQVIDAQSRPIIGAFYPPEPVYPALVRLGWTNSLASLGMMDRLSDDLRQAKPGEAYIVHLLLPHVPSVVDPNCKVLPVRDWDRRIERSPMAPREAAYYDQTRCTLRKIDRLLLALSQSPAGPNSIVLFHGDHGSRLWQNIPDKRFYRYSTDADYVAGFSTLFAVRSPQIGSAYVEQPAPVADLLRQLVESRFTKLPKPPPGPPMVWLADADWHPWKRVEMPESWWKSPATGSGPAHD